MRRGSFANAFVRALFAAAFLAGAWFVAGQAVSMALLGDSSPATVVGYWQREPDLDYRKLTRSSERLEPIREPTVRIAEGRTKHHCDTVYRGLRYSRELPSRGTRFDVVFRPDTLQNCVASSTVFSGLRIGLGAILSLIGLTLAGSAVSDLAV